MNVFVVVGFSKVLPISLKILLLIHSAESIDKTKETVTRMSGIVALSLVFKILKMVCTVCFSFLNQ